MQQDAALAQVVGRMFGVFNSGDASTADTLLSREPGILGIGTDPREWWVGEAVWGAFRAQAPEMKAAGFHFEPGAVQAHSEGSVGWLACQPVLSLPDGARVPMRLTAVCRQEGGAWKMVQFHLSTGAANEEVLDEELTI